jgi:hypothetical protein
MEKNFSTNSKLYDETIDFIMESMRKKKISFAKMAAVVDMTEQGLRHSIRAKTLKAERFITMLNFLGVNVGSSILPNTQEPEIGYGTQDVIIRSLVARIKELEAMLDDKTK